MEFIWCCSAAIPSFHDCLCEKLVTANPEAPPFEIKLNKTIPKAEQPFSEGKTSAREKKVAALLEQRRRKLLTRCSLLLAFASQGELSHPTASQWRVVAYLHSTEKDRLESPLSSLSLWMRMAFRWMQLSSMKLLEGSMC
jgi:hypothetical protein